MRKIADSSKTEWRVALRARAEARSRPKGFSTTTRASLEAARLGEALHDGREDARRDGEIVGRAARGAELLAQRRVGPGVVVVAVDVAQPGDEPLERRRVEAAVLLDALAGASPELLESPARLRDPDDRHVETSAPAHRLQGGEDLLVGEVASGAEEDERVGPLWGFHRPRYLHPTRIAEHGRRALPVARGASRWPPHGPDVEARSRKERTTSSVRRWTAARST